MYGYVLVVLFFFFLLEGPCVRNTFDESAIFPKRQRGGLSQEKKKNDIRWTKLVKIYQEVIQEQDHFAGCVFIDEVLPQSGSFLFVFVCVSLLLLLLQHFLKDHKTLYETLLSLYDYMNFFCVPYWTWCEIFFSLCHFNTPNRVILQTQETCIKDTTWSLCLCGGAQANSFVWRLSTTANDDDKKQIITTEKFRSPLRVSRPATRKLGDLTQTYTESWLTKQNKTKQKQYQYHEIRESLSWEALSLQSEFRVRLHAAIPMV